MFQWAPLLTGKIRFLHPADLLADLLFQWAPLLTGEIRRRLLAASEANHEFQWAPLLTGEISRRKARRPGRVLRVSMGSPSYRGDQSAWHAAKRGSVHRFNGLPFLQGRSGLADGVGVDVVAVSMGSPSYRGDQPQVCVQSVPGSSTCFNGLPFLQGRSGL